jgi:hypothetical protein
MCFPIESSDGGTWLQCTLLNLEEIIEEQTLYARGLHGNRYCSGGRWLSSGQDFENELELEIR